MPTTSSRAKSPQGPALPASLATTGQPPLSSREDPYHFLRIAPPPAHTAHIHTPHLTMHWDSLFPCRLFCSFPPELLIYLFAGVRSAQRYFDTPHDLALKGARFHDWADMGNSLGWITCYLHIWMEQIDVYLSVTYYFSAWKEKSILSMEAYWLICNRMNSEDLFKWTSGLKFWWTTDTFWSLLR